MQLSFVYVQRLYEVMEEGRQEDAQREHRVTLEGVLAARFGRDSQLKGMIGSIDSRLCPVAAAAFWSGS